MPGLFGLLHGVHPTSYEVFRSAPRDHQSVLVRSAARAGLEVHVHTSGSLERFALRSLFFGDVPAERYHQLRDDARLVEAWTQSLPADPRVGRFDFLFLTSTHSPYHCPKEEIRFQPLPAIEGRYALDADADPIPYRNDYKNSARHVDRLLGLVVAELERRGRLDDTWIVVTGDHGEEFNEGGQGYWGHGSNFGRWQVQVPLVLVGPGAPVGVVERRVSLHQDIAPTLMEMALGCTTPPEAYSHGTSLLRLPERRATVLSSYVESAYWIDGVVVEKRIGRRYRFDDLSPAAEPDREALRRVFEEERRFLGR